MKRYLEAVSGLCFILLSASACSLFHMSPVQVVSWSPTESWVEDISEISVVLTFSSHMDPALTEEAFSFTAEGDEIAGAFSWKGKSVTFRPFVISDEYRDFTIALADKAEDKYGNNLEEEFSHRFSRRTERFRPAVVEVSPTDGGVTDDLHTPVRVLFSEHMDKTSVQRGFSIDPEADGIFSWGSSGDRFSYRPTEELIWQQQYTVTLDAAVCDLQGNGLGEEFSFSFKLGSDSIPPALQRISNSEGTLSVNRDDPDDGFLSVTPGWECFWDLRITFSEPVERKGLESCLKFSPPADFSIENTGDPFVSSAECIFTEPLDYDELYTLTVKEGIIDRYGNSMAETEVYRFRSDGVRSLPPAIKALTFLDDPGGFPPAIGAYNAYDSINLSSYDPGPADGFFDIYFDAAEAAGPDLLSFIDNFSLSLDSESALSIRVIGIETGTNAAPPSTGPAPFPAVSSGEYLFRVHVEIANPGVSSGILTLRLSPDYCDSLGNKIESEWVFILNEATP